MNLVRGSRYAVTTKPNGTVVGDSYTPRDTLIRVARNYDVRCDIGDALDRYLTELNYAATHVTFTNARIRLLSDVSYEDGLADAERAVRSVDVMEMLTDQEPGR